MAKKGGLQQLQVEINTDEEFERYLDRYPNALILIDIYSEWCGPCTGVVNLLRKTKLEIGGDNLQMAVCKCDYITKLSRFRKKSEPTWMFIRDHQSVNFMFGTNVPELVNKIKAELDLVHVPISERNYIGIEELHPVEQVRENIKRNAREAKEYKERYEREKKRRDYLMTVTDAIMDNLPDGGVSIFGTHINRDMFKKLNEPAEALKMQWKDKRYQPATKEDFETANFVCENPLPEDVIDQMTEDNVFMCYWKVPDEKGRGVPYVMNQYIHELTKKVVEPADDYFPERVIPPIIEPVKIKVQYEVEAHEICPEYEDEILRESRISMKDSPEEDYVDYEDMYEEEEYVQMSDDQAAMPTIEILTFDDDDAVNDEEEQIAEEEELAEGPPPRKTCTKVVTMPAVWAPNDARSHAALIYAFFRTQTLPFLTPEPPPEPPHVVMAFETKKKAELIDIAERYPNDIPLYGFFTSDDADEAKFIANNPQKYVQLTTPSKQAEDKIIFKVYKATSNMMLSLASYGATYVSPNTTIGKEEALKFFPSTYRTAAEDREAAEDGKEPMVAEPDKEEDEILDSEIDDEDYFAEGDYGEELDEDDDIGEGPLKT